MATEVIKSIRASGGDYTSLSAWVSAMQSTYPDLTSSDVILIAECYNDWPSGLSEQVVVNGFTTDSTRYIIIRAASGHQHDGTPDTGFKIVYTTNNSVLRVYSLYTLVEGIQFEANGSYTSGYVVRIELQADGSIIDKCLVIQNWPSGSGHIGIKSYVTPPTLADAPIVRNTVVISQNYGYGIDSNRGGSIQEFIAENCTVAHCDYGFNTANNELIVKNCVAYNCTTSFNNTYHTNSTNNAASDGSSVTPPGTNPLTVDIVSSDFVDASNGDFSIPSTSQLRDAGSDLSTEFTTDIIGNPRDA